MPSADVVGVEGYDLNRVGRNLVLREDDVEHRDVGVSARDDAGVGCSPDAASGRSSTGNGGACISMAFAGTQHHAVLAEGDRLLVLIGSDVPDGENRHGRPMIRPLDMHLTRQADRHYLLSCSGPQLDFALGLLLGTSR